MKRFTFDMIVDEENFPLMSDYIERLISGAIAYANEWNFDMKDVTESGGSEDAEQ